MKLKASKEVYQCKLFRVTEDEAEEDGFEVKRSIVRHRGSAVIMPVDEQNRILLVHQLRVPAGKKLWELPAGKVDEGESVRQAAERELKEETGYSAKQWAELVSFYPSPGYVEERMTIFLATDLTEGRAQPMEDERIEKRWFTAAELDRLIQENKMEDGKTLAGYLLWARRQ